MDDWGFVSFGGLLSAVCLIGLFCFSGMEFMILMV